ncbi:MAG: helix-turn-helix domain-containing protein [Prevotellaceae bacterium]|jgi:hypothetical protein|nr:helix-turn-helix domain-containing protein [Prevotellaceae bacterium]
MAERLCMTQSQYQRRERGEIRITDDEWLKIAKILGKEVEDVREEDPITTIFNYDNNSGNYSQSTNNFYGIPDFIMKNQQEYIEMLKNEILSLKAELAELKK